MSNLHFLAGESMNCSDARHLIHLDVGHDLRADEEQQVACHMNHCAECRAYHAGMSNAMDALEEGDIRSPRVDVTMGENLAGNEVWVRVADNARGIDEETRAKMFDPFYTSRENGTGLGLALCRKIVDAHRGTIEVDSAPGEGTEFVMTFPRQQGRSNSPSEGAR